MFIDSWKVVEQFEQRMADYCGAPYAVAVDTCTAAIFLCLKCIGAQSVTIPARTYLGVACAAHHAGCRILFDDYEWEGGYSIATDRGVIVDSACNLSRGLAKGVPGINAINTSLICLSFQSRKHLKIGRGGMILTDVESYADWLRKARFCGRSGLNGIPEFIGWHAFMEPERAARGLVLMDSLPAFNSDLIFDYPDLREYKVFQ